MATQLTDLHVGLVSFVDRAAQRSAQDPTQPQRFLLWKAEGAYDEKGNAMPEATATAETTETEINKEELDDSVRAYVEKLERERDEALEKGEPKDVNSARDPSKKTARKDGKSTEMDGAPVNKAELDPAVRAIVEKAEEREREARERLEKAEETASNAEKLAKAEVDRRVTAEYIAKAETGELRGLPGAPAETGPVLKAIAEALPEQYAELEKSVLGPAAEQLRRSELFKEHGRGGGEGAPSDSAYSQLKKKADEIQKADASVSKADAMERARRENPELERALHAELGAGHARQ